MTAKLKTTVSEQNGLMLARIESEDRVFEVSFDSIEPTDQTAAEGYRMRVL